MPAPASTNAPKSNAADSSRPDYTWYGAFASTADDAKAQADTSPATPSSEPSFPDPLYTLSASDIPGPHMRRDRDGTTLPALLSLQHAELDRLVRDNGRLMDRIETLLQIQGREQVLRQQLQSQVDRIAEQMKHPVPTATLEAMRQETRKGVTEEIKPVLMAILDVLERFTSKTGAQAAASQNPASTEPFLGEEYGKLPAILTRPLDELMDEGNPPRRSDSETANRRPRSPFRKRKRARTHLAPDSARENTDRPAPFTSSTVFSS